MNLPKKNIGFSVLMMVTGLFLGWLIFGGGGDAPQSTAEEHVHDENSTWTCSMHPQIRQNEPGLCPICGMDLIKLDQTETMALAPNEIQMTEAALKVAEIQTIKVTTGSSEKEIYLPGKVKTNESSMSEISAHFNGRIEKLYINFTGQPVKRGQLLASIYSPQLVTAQKELLEALKLKDSNPSIYKAARNKLKLWEISDQQIDQIISNREPEYYFNVYSPISGTITNLYVSLGDHIIEGKSLMEVANLNKVWVVFNAYENDLQWINTGDSVEFSIQSLPGHPFKSAVTFIDPMVNPKTRTIAIRSELDNRQGLLKPEMIVNGTIRANSINQLTELVIPITSVLWTGKRSIVYVKKANTTTPTFEYREVALGVNTGNHYVVQEGLKEGEEIVVNGAFKIDAAAQLSGKTSMMNPDNGEEEMHEEMITTYEVSDGFQKQLKGVFDTYLSLIDALVASDGAKSKEEATKLKASLDHVDMKLLKGEAHNQWMTYLTPIQDAVESMVKTEEIEAHRHALISLSDNLYKSIKSFNIEGLNGYYQFCPMADNNKGAYWLSTSNEIKNPYYGDAMLRCGETVEEMK